MYAYFSENKIDISAMVIRWFLVLFLNEYEIDKSLMLWDSIMGAPNQDKISILDHCVYLALAIIHLNRHQILEEDVNPLILFSKLEHEPREII